MERPLVDLKCFGYYKSNLPCLSCQFFGEGIANKQAFKNHWLILSLMALTLWQQSPNHFLHAFRTTLGSHALLRYYRFPAE